MNANPRNYGFPMSELACAGSLPIPGSDQFRKCDCPAYLEVEENMQVEVVVNARQDKFLRSATESRVRGAYWTNYPYGHRVEDVNQWTVADLLSKKDITKTVCRICHLPVRWIRRTGGMRNGAKGYWQHERATK
jgi:hypothetical protein